MKDVLDYTEEELRATPVEELEKLKHTAKEQESLFNTRQMVEKVLINSLYGALANKSFPLFNEQIAAAITGNGRFFIQMLAQNIEARLQELIPAEKPYITYGDTDSVTGDTLVKTARGDVKIEDLYNDLEGDIEVRGKDNLIKHVTNPVKAASVNKHLETEYNNVNYVMKHKVKKRMFKIKCNGDEVTITEDHSMMVVRNGELIEIKPRDVKKTDKLVKILS